MTVRPALAILGLSFLAVLPREATAQVHRTTETTRASFLFLDHELTIDVLADAPGVVRIIRGRPGRIEVSGSSSGGVVGFGLASRQFPELALTAVEAERVIYLVVVPEGTYVRLRLPDRDVAETLGALENAGTFEWGAPPRR